MDLVYAKKNKDNQRICEFYLGGIVGEQINGAYIEADMAFINQGDFADRIDFHINTEGGDVLEGVRIISAIFKSKIPVRTYNDGFAMSMGAFIFLSAKKENRYAAFFSNTMIHAARFVDEKGNMIDSEDEDDKIYLNVINKMLSDITESTTGKTKQQLAKILSKDTFFNADEMVSAGFLPKANIIKYEQMPQFKSDASVREKIHSIAAFYNEQNNKPNNNKMSELKSISAKLNLHAEASVIAINERIDSIIAEKNDALNELKEANVKIETNVSALAEKDGEITKLNASIDKYKEEEKKRTKEKAVATVKEAIKEGKFLKEDEEELTAMAVESPELFSKLVSKANVSKKVEAPDLNKMLNDDSVTKLCAEFGLKPEEMNYNHLWRNDPKKLEAIKNKAPKLYETLQNNWEE